MPRYEAQSATNLPFQSCLVFGASRSGKTHFCATFPQVAMLCSRRERGYITIEHMDPKAFYDPKVPPQVYVVDDIQSLMMDLHKNVIPQIQAGKLKTVCVELTFHADTRARRHWGAGCIRRHNSSPGSWDRMSCSPTRKAS